MGLLPEVIACISMDHIRLLVKFSVQWDSLLYLVRHNGSVKEFTPYKPHLHVKKLLRVVSRAK